MSSTPTDMRPVRCFQPYDSYTRANRLASHRLGHAAKKRVGEFFWTHPAVPGRAFPTRKAALAAAKGGAQ